MEEVTEVPPAISNPVLDPEPEVIIEEPSPPEVPEPPPPAEIPENPNNNDGKWKRNLLIIVAVSALVVALITIFV